MTTLIHHLQLSHNKRTKKPSSYKVEIIYRILEAASKYPPIGISQYHLQYLAEINQRQLKDYLSYLVNNGLLFVTLDKRRRTPKALYHVSQKGLAFLNLYDSSTHKEDLLYAVSQSDSTREIRQGERLQHHEGEKGGDS